MAYRCIRKPGDKAEEGLVADGCILKTDSILVHRLITNCGVVETGGVSNQGLKSACKKTGA